MSTPDLPEAAARAANLHVVVVGGGMAGLVAALQCAKVGIAVTVVEASDRLGGTVRAAQLGGVMLDAGADSFSHRGGHVRALIDEVGLGADVVESVPGRAWVAGLPGGAVAPLPDDTVLGIPGSPFAPEVRAIVGWGGAWRAFADRVKPVLTIGKQRSLGELVRSRLGERVRERLVAPVTTGVYGVDPDDIDVDIAAPGLNGALTSTGSLLGAVAAQLAERQTGGSTLGSIDGGMLRLVDALRARLELLGVRFQTETRVGRVSRDGDGWVVEIEGLDAAPDALRADAVIVATPEGEARRLLGELWPDGVGHEFPVETVTLLLETPGLDPAPRGTTVYTVPGTHGSAVVALKSSTWEWLGRAAGARHVVRVSFGTQAEPPVTEGLGDEEAFALAVRAASTLLGAPFGPEALVAGRRERFVQTLPGAALGRMEATRAVRESLADTPTLGVVGAWLAGSGLAQVVPDATQEAQRVRDAVLWT